MPPRERPYHHGDLRTALLAAAIREIESVGVEHLSLRSLAAEVGVSPSAAYHHFADKDGLLKAVGACGLAALDERMARVWAAHSADTAEAAKARFLGLGRAYVGFAIDETHLFQLTFGPLCAPPGPPPYEDGPYRKLMAAIDDLDRWGLLKPDIRSGLDLMVWASTHGMATLLVEHLLPAESVEEFLDSMARLLLTDEA